MLSIRALTEGNEKDPKKPTQRHATSGHGSPGAKTSTTSHQQPTSSSKGKASAASHSIEPAPNLGPNSTIMKGHSRGGNEIPKRSLNHNNTNNESKRPKPFVAPPSSGVGVVQPNPASSQNISSSSKAKITSTKRPSRGANQSGEQSATAATTKQRKTPGVKVSCGVCGKTYSDKTSLAGHESRREEAKVKCQTEGCTQKEVIYCNKEHLKAAHHDKVHKGIPFVHRGHLKCNGEYGKVCESKNYFYTDYEFKNHINKKHKGEVYGQCKHCLRVFDVKSKYDGHTKTREELTCKEPECANKPEDERVFCAAIDYEDHYKYKHPDKTVRTPGYVCNIIKDGKLCKTLPMAKDTMKRHLWLTHQIDYRVPGFQLDKYAVEQS